jgi:Icc-related predicted phosphoesterase
MIIDCISDLHGFYPQLEGGDLLIIAGDLTSRDEHFQYIQFYSWLHKQNYSHYLFIAGNHDNLIQKHEVLTTELAETTYLCDSGVKMGGFHFWGSPWTSTFDGMNPKCKAFTMDTEEELAEKWALIPEDTEILVTHSPPKGIFDTVERDDGSSENTGSLSLLRRARQLPNLKLFVFGHIHQGYGVLTPQGMMNTAKERPDVPPTCKSVPYIVNASHVNEYYEPVNKPIRIEL